MGVYSPNMLLHFPEQFRSFLYFDMAPNINDGYTPGETSTTIWGIIQNAASATKESNGNLVQSNHMNLWTDTQLNRGKFVSFESIIFRIVDGNDWPTEGGFYSYTLERLVGNNGTADATTWKIGGTQV